MGTCRTLLLLALSGWAVVGRGQAQISWLTLSESEQILENLPEFRASEARGDCPGFILLGANRPRQFSLQFKAFCVPEPEGFVGSTTIGNYAIDRVTGGLIEWASGHPASEPLEVQPIARSLAAKAKARTLSHAEAQCVARQAARDEVGLSSSLVVTQQKNKDRGSEVGFEIQSPLDSLHATAVWVIAVDVGWPTVLEGLNGPRMNSTRVDELLFQMRTARTSPSLSAVEAMEIAVKVPSIAARLSGTCSKLLAADFGTSTKRFVTVEDTCQAYPRAAALIASVDILTGAVTEPKTQKVLDSPESIGLAQELLRRARERQQTAKAEIERACEVR